MLTYDANYIFLENMQKYLTFSPSLNTHDGMGS